MKKIIFLLLLFPFLIQAQSPGTDEAKKKAYDLLESCRRRIIKGESFGTFAALYSDDPGSAQNGGIYKGILPGTMVKEFEKVAYSLKPGDVSEIFETQYGLHIIQLIARRGDELDLRHILVIPK